MITAAITTSLIPTMIELIRALSEMPMYSTYVISITISSAGRLMIAPGADPGAWVIATGR